MLRVTQAHPVTFAPSPPPPPPPSSSSSFYTHSSQPIIDDSATDSQYREAADLLGLTLREMVALHGRVRSSSLAQLQGYNGSWTKAAASFGNQFFTTLFAETWQKVSAGGVVQFKANGKDMYVKSIPHRAFVTHSILTSTLPVPFFFDQIHGAR